MIYFTQEYIASLIEPWKKKYGKDDFSRHLDNLRGNNNWVYYVLKKMVSIYERGEDYTGNMSDFQIGSLYDDEFCRLSSVLLDAGLFQMDPLYFCEYFAIKALVGDDGDWVDLDVSRLGDVYGKDAKGFEYYPDFEYYTGYYMTKNLVEDFFLPGLIYDPKSKYNSHIYCFNIIHELVSPIFDEIIKTYTELADRIFSITKFLLEKRQELNTYYSTAEGKEEIVRLTAMGARPYEWFEELSVNDFWMDDYGNICYLNNAQFYEDVWSQILAERKQEKETKDNDGLEVVRRRGGR